MCSLFTNAIFFYFCHMQIQNNIQPCRSFSSTNKGITTRCFRNHLIRKTSQTQVSLQSIHTCTCKPQKTSENVPSKCAPSEDSDQPAHSRSLIRIFTRRILDSQDSIVSLIRGTKSDQTALILAFVGLNSIVLKHSLQVPKPNLSYCVFPFCYIYS